MEKIVILIPAVFLGILVGGCGSSSTLAQSHSQQQQQQNTQNPNQQSQNQSLAVENTTTNSSSEDQNHTVLWISITSPKEKEPIEPGSILIIEGKVAEPAFKNHTLDIKLFSGSAETKNTSLIHEGKLEVGNDGNFKGMLQLPNEPLPKALLTMVFQVEFPHAPTYNLTLIPKS